MASPLVDLRNPFDDDADKWLERYESYQSLAQSRPRLFARMYSWVYEWQAWAMAVVTVLGIVLWLYVPGWFVWIGMALISGWVLSGLCTPRLVREYNQLIEDRRILQVPEIVLELYGQAVHKINPQYPINDDTMQLRFGIIREVMSESADLVGIVAADCGCKEPCSHEGRLYADRTEPGAVTRVGMRKRLRTVLTRKLEQAGVAPAPEP